MSQIHPLTLSFRNPALEQSFFQATLDRTRRQGQAAMAVGILVYLLHGLLDHWFVAPALIPDVWAIRLATLCIPLVGIALSFTPWFPRLCYPLLAAVGLAAGSGLIGMLMLLPVASAAYYYPMMVVVTFYTYNFIGTRFILALAVDMVLLMAYNLIFGGMLDYPLRLLLSHDFFMVSANLIGGAAGYLAERQRRVLFLREREVDTQRQHHLIRSLHDGLTGLPNRELLQDRITQAIAEAQRDGSVHCGFFLDLDGFKAINDQLNHETGDRVLREVAQRLSKAVRAMDTVARIGGDEFFVVALDIGHAAAAVELAQTLLDQFCAPLAGLPAHLQPGVSIGMCLFPYEGMTISHMMQRADEAMYQVKHSGKGRFALASTRH